MTVAWGSAALWKPCKVERWQAWIIRSLCSSVESLSLDGRGKGEVSEGDSLARVDSGDRGEVKRIPLPLTPSLSGEGGLLP